MDDMEIVLNVSSLGHSIRNKSGIKLRQSLTEVRIVVEDSVSNRLERFKRLLREELNVKSVTLSAQEEDLVNYKIRLLPNILGKKYGSLFPKIGAAVTSEDAKELASLFRQGVSVDLEVEGRDVTLLPEEVEIRTEAKEGWETTKDGGLTVGLDIVITDGLKAEGLARDIVRRIQNQRKEAGYRIADEIETYYDAGPKLVKVFESYGFYIAAETLSKHIDKVDPPKNAFVRVYELDGEKLRIGLVQIEK
jgi:isoleucyl-tRNA synthetase